MSATGNIKHTITHQVLRSRHTATGSRRGFSSFTAIRKSYVWVIICATADGSISPTTPTSLYRYYNRSRTVRERRETIEGLVFLQKDAMHLPMCYTSNPVDVEDLWSWILDPGSRGRSTTHVHPPPPLTTLDCHAMHICCTQVTTTATVNHPIPAPHPMETHFGTVLSFLFSSLSFLALLRCKHTRGCNHDPRQPRRTTYSNHGEG